MLARHSHLRVCGFNGILCCKQQDLDDYRAKHKKRGEFIMPHPERLVDVGRPEDVDSIDWAIFEFSNEGITHRELAGLFGYPVAEIRRRVKRVERLLPKE